MKKLPYLLFPLTLLSFSQAIHAQNDASAIVISQSITNTPDANGQYTATIEAFVKGESSGNPSYVSVPVTKQTIYELLGFASFSELHAWAYPGYNTTRSINSTTYYFKEYDELLYYNSQDVKYWPLYIGVQKKLSSYDESNYFIIYYGDGGTKRFSNHPDISSPKQASKSYEISGLYRETTPWNAKYDALGEASTISETFDGFLIPQNPTIKIKSADCNGAPGGNPSFSTTMNNASATVSPSTDRKSITISGFDFSTNACGNDGSANHGKKLIVTFPVATTVSNTGGSAMTVVNTVTVTNKNSQPVTGFNSSTATLDLPNLTIQASGVNTNDNCIFTVSGTAGSSWNKTFTVMTHGTTPVKLQALPAGTYTITPKSWPWTYNLPAPKNNVTLTGAGCTETFNFTPKSITTPHHGEATASTPAN